MSEISDMDWAQYIKMEYAYNLRKDLAKAKKGPSLNFYTILLVNYHREVYIILWKRMIKLVQSKMVGGNELFLWIYEIYTNLR